MLAYTLLSPSDNKRLQGTFKAFYDALLKPSDNKPILSGLHCDDHYIECAFNIIPKYISSYYVIPQYNISYYIIPKYNIQYDKVCIFGSILYACATPPYPKISTSVFFEGVFANLPQTKLSFCTLPLVQCRKVE